MSKSIQEFFNLYNGKAIDDDGAYGVQCVDGFRVYCKWLGIAAYPTPNGWADGYWYSRGEHVGDFTPIMGSNNFQNGDVVIWARRSGSHPNSHIAIYLNGQEFGQRQQGDGSRAFCLKSTTFSDALGALRPKALTPTVVHTISYSAHVQDIGWQKEVHEGETAGTTGQSKRLEALKIATLDGSLVEYVKLHMQDVGWKTYNAPGKDTVIGTVNEARRIEDICIKLNGYKFRVHIQNFGWTPWTACDGISTLGTVGQSLRIEAIQIKK